MRPTSSQLRSRRALALAALVLLLLAGFLAVRAASGLLSDAVRGYDPGASRVVHYDVASSALDGRRLEQTLVLPPGGGRGRPLLVFLHGRGEDGNDSNLSDELFAGLARLGDPAPVILFPDGGEASYWHDRADGDWGAYVVRDAIPAALRRAHADPRRVAIGGVSMGGFGAYDLARLNPGRFCAVGGHSAALWERGGESAPGAFDDAEDFARHDLIAAARAGGGTWDGVPLWLDGGEEDPFRPGLDAFAAALRADGAQLETHVWPGEHEGGYWRAHMASYLRFYARALARCAR